ncbi:hypothetical protein GQ457_06G008930 [Hibiscus cannabinus]
MESRRGCVVQSRCFTVFVGNLSPKVHWRFLKKLFQRFGRVLDVFIPRKSYLSGSNFGFVRFPSLREAETTVFMFNGAWVVDRRIQVNIAKFGCRSTYWRKKQPKDVSRAAIHQTNEGDVRTSFWKNKRVTTSAVNQRRGETRGSQEPILEDQNGAEEKNLPEELKEVRSEDESLDSGVNKTTFTEKKKVNLLFSTKQVGKKENVILAEVGSILVEFRIAEMGVKVSVNGIEIDKVRGESSPASCVETIRQSEPERTVVNGGLDKVENFNAVIIGKDFNNYVGGFLNLGSSHIGERELVGGGSHDLQSEKAGSNKCISHLESQGGVVSRNGPSWVDIVNSNRPGEESVNPSFVLDENRSTGLGFVEDSCSFEGGIGSAGERVECPIEVEHTEDEDFKQSSIKHMRLRRWLLNNQKKDGKCLEARGAVFTELIAIKTALQVFTEAIWEGIECLVIESVLKVILFWFSEPTNRPWRWWDDLMSIDALVRKIGKDVFSHVSRLCNSMTGALAKEGLYRQNLFKVWW